MSNDKIIQCGDIPHILIQEMIDVLQHFTLGFYKTVPTANGNEPFLLGSGTLISCNGKYGILTAHHVIEALPKTGRLGVILEKNQINESLDTGGLQFVPIERGRIDAEGPDLGLIILSEILASTIAAKKSFFALDEHISHLSKDEIDFSNELWLSQGFIDERTVTLEAPERNCMVRQFYNLCGLGQPTRHYFKDPYDYVEFPYQKETGHNVPSSFGGTSGGAFWQIPLRQSSIGEVTFGPPCLRGVIFYQEWSDLNNGLLRGHGPKSIYGIIPGVLCADRP